MLFFSKKFEIAFTITGSTYSNKQVVLINHSWNSPTLHKEWRLEVCLFFPKVGDFSEKNGRLVKWLYEVAKGE